MTGSLGGEGTADADGDVVAFAETSAGVCFGLFCVPESTEGVWLGLLLSVAGVCKVRLEGAGDVFRSEVLRSGGAIV